MDLLTDLIPSLPSVCIANEKNDGDAQVGM